MKKIDWTIWESKLGVLSDAELAKAIGCPRQYIFRERKKRGIVLSDKSKFHIDWTRWDKWLGEFYDFDLAKKIGCDIWSVRNRRRAKGIPAKRKQVSRIQWKKYKRVLGTMTDDELAKKIGCSSASILYARARFGIAPYRPTARNGNLDKFVEMLGSVPDSKLAKIVGVSTRTVSRERKRREIPLKVDGRSSHRIDWSQWIDHLGKKSDCALAQEIGCCQMTVTVKRNKLGIAPKHARKESIKWHEVLDKFPTMTDTEIARLLGISSSSVMRARKRYGAEKITKNGRLEPFESLIGVIPDAVVANLAKCHLATVQVRRRTLGLKNCKRATYRLVPTNSQMEAMKKVANDQEIEAALCVTK